MFWFWSIVAVIFLIAELVTVSFGFIFITFGSVIIAFLLQTGVIVESDYLCQLLIILLFGIIGFIFFYINFKKSKSSKDSNFKEDMVAVVIEKDLRKGVDGKIKWSGTIFNAAIKEDSNVDKISVGDNEFKGNVAIVTKIN